MRTIKINNELFEVSDAVTSFEAGLVELSKALPDKPEPEQVAESKRALDAIKAYRAELKAKAKAEAEVTTTEGAK